MNRVKHLKPLMLLLLVLLAYANSFQADFTMDSAIIARDDPRVQYFNVRSLRLIFTGDYWAAQSYSDLYRPLTTLSFLLNNLISKSPAGFHAFNLLLHAANVLLIAALAGRCAGGMIGWLAAAVFAVHPLGVETVTNLVGRADLLATLAMLLGLESYRRWQEGGDTRWLAALVAAAILGVFCKEHAVMLVGLLVAWDLCMAGRVDWRRKLPGYGALIPSWILLFAARKLVLEHSPFFTHAAGDNPLVLQGAISRVPSALSVQGRYLGLFFWPARLSCDYSFDRIPMWNQSWISAAWLGVFLAAVIAIYLLGRRNRAIWFFALVAAAVMLPTSNLLMPIGTIMAERFMYLPVAMLAAIVALAVRPLLLRLRIPRSSPILAILALLILVPPAIRTHYRNRDWKDEISLWSSARIACPESFKTHQNLAASLQMRDGQERSAQPMLDLVLQARRIIESDRLPMVHRPIATYITLSQLYGTLGDLEAGRALNLGLSPNEAGRPWYEKGLEAGDRALEIEKITNEAARQKRLAAGLRPDKIHDFGRPDLHEARAALLDRLGEATLAMASIDQARRFAPGKPQYHLDAAKMLITHQDLNTAAIRGWQAMLTNSDVEAWSIIERVYSRLAPGQQLILRTPGRTGINLQHPLIQRHLDQAMRELMILCRRAEVIDDGLGILNIYRRDILPDASAYEKILESPDPVFP